MERETLEKMSKEQLINYICNLSSYVGMLQQLSEIHERMITSFQDIKEYQQQVGVIYDNISGVVGILNDYESIANDNNIEVFEEHHYTFNNESVAKDDEGIKPLVLDNIDEEV